MSNLIKVSSERRMRKWLKKTTEQNLFRVLEFRGASECGVESSHVEQSRWHGMGKSIASWQLTVHPKKQDNKNESNCTIDLTLWHARNGNFSTFLFDVFSLTLTRKLLRKWLSSRRNARWEMRDESIREKQLVSKSKLTAIMCGWKEKIYSNTERERERER